MRNLLRSRRGTLAFAAVVAAIPLIAVVGLGAEAGSWYVTKQHAQNAADAAAYSGALKLACSLGATSDAPCADVQSVDYRARQFAAQNDFCHGRNATSKGSPACASLLPTGTSQTVVVDQPTSWNGTNGSFVRATVSQTQPTYLVAVLGSLADVSIGAQAIAQVHSFASPCILALTGSISFQGSPNITAPGCGMASNSTASNAINFTGGGMTLDVGSLSASGGCTGNTNYCKTALTNMPSVTNPFSALDALTVSITKDCPSKSSLTPYSAANPCKNNGVSLNDPGNAQINLATGVYFIADKLEVKGNNPYVGNALFILLPGASFSMKGSGSFNITGIPSVQTSQVPSALSTYAHAACETVDPNTKTNTCLLDNMAIYAIPGPNASDNPAITIGGNSNITFNGDMYLPKRAVTFQGNPKINSSTCGNQLIAGSLAFNGNATLKFDFNNAGCSASTKPSSQYVALVK